MRSSFKAVGVAALVVFLVTACGLNPSTETRDRLGVQAATMALIERAADPADKAQRVLDAVTKARVMLDLSDVSVGDLRVALLARVAEHELTPLEKLAALEAINAVSDEVERRLGRGFLTADQRVSVNRVLGWVEDAAHAYVP